MKLEKIKKAEIETGEKDNICLLPKKQFEALEEKILKKEI